MNIVGAAHRPMAIGILAAIAISVGGAAPVAHANGTDDFVRQVRAQGIGVNTPDAALVRDAQEVCDMLDYQESAYQYLTQHSGLDRQHAALFVTDSTTYYCPQYPPG
jgi:hypothetical protein